MPDTCPFCGHHGMTQQRIDYLYRDGEAFMVVTGVPCLVCDFCGEPYFSARVLKSIETDFHAIRAEERKPSRVMQVPVEEYAGP